MYYILDQARIGPRDSGVPTKVERARLAIHTHAFVNLVSFGLLDWIVMLDITGQEISKLNDSDLRSLVGMLCEADVRDNGLAVAGITWGGHQNAPDGGLDVRAELPGGSNSCGFLPRNITGFQVKKSDMPRAEILKEMRPDGVIRPVIKELASSNGAYIIVSSTGSTSDSALQNRRKAMKEALRDVDCGSDLALDFFDRDRIASWVRNHPQMVVWVRDKIGDPIHGWRAYDNWANAPGGLEEEYLIDDRVRLQDDQEINNGNLTIAQGIDRLRESIRSPRSSVRLAGLSGVGKTRLVQALFDERIGQRALNQYQVFYCDVGDDPEPDPRTFAERLISRRSPAVLVVDNCPPSTHRRLASVCSAPGSCVSLVTIEYDVREDKPLETSVFRLEPASDDLMELLVRRRYPHIGQVDARTIAKISGGNARIAIAIADTVKTGESLANLRDEEIFDRLFYQRHESGQQLLRSAEVCSLVYSFACDFTTDQRIELERLSSLAGRTASELFADVAELRRRELLQQRGVWRALLPHALANRLAERALENIPRADILNALLDQKCERLLKSFAKRLSYLHENSSAIKIVEDWLSNGGLLQNASNLSQFGLDLFTIVAPVSPEKTLQAIERAANDVEVPNFCTRENRHHIEFTRLLRTLAYDQTLFDRCITLLCRFALSENRDEKDNSIRDLLRSLFFVHLSGTHATIDQRFTVVQKLLASSNSEQKTLGVELLGAGLEAWHFSNSYGFEFGARSRNYGYWPKTQNEIKSWFRPLIDLICTLVESGDELAPKAKSLLADKFRGLWIKAGLCDELVVAAERLHAAGPWNEGWVAVRMTIRFDEDGLDSDQTSKLRNLEKILRPGDLVEKVRTYALSNSRNAMDIVDGEIESTVRSSDAYQRVEETTRKLGVEVASDNEIFESIAAEIVSTDGTRLFSFGRGLAEGCEDKSRMWKHLVGKLSETELEKRVYGALFGFLHQTALQDSSLAETLLEEALTEESLSRVFPVLQSSVVIDSAGVEKLLRALELGDAPIHLYQNIAYGRSHESINDTDLSRLVREIASKEDGVSVALEILNMRLHGLRMGTDVIPDTIKGLGQDLLLLVNFDRQSGPIGHEDYGLAEIVKACFTDGSAASCAENVIGNFAQALDNFNVFPMNYERLLSALAKTQPAAFLDGLFGAATNMKATFVREIVHDKASDSNPISNISDGTIIDWCEINPETRYPTIASQISPFKGGKREEELDWSPLALTMIDTAPDPTAILDQFLNSLRPNSWSGSRADIIEGRLPLIESLIDHHNSIVSIWAQAAARSLTQEIRAERDREMATNLTQRDLSFE